MTMESKLRLTAKGILDKKFTKDVKGYNPDEVDAFLDEIISDYQTCAKLFKDKDAKIVALENEIRAKDAEYASSLGKFKTLYERAKQLEIENASLTKKLEGIKPGDRVTAENLEWIQRCRKLENFLYQHGFTEADLK